MPRQKGESTVPASVNIPEDLYVAMERHRIEEINRTGYDITRTAYIVDAIRRKAYCDDS